MTSLNVLLVDPSLFTAPYDAALSDGLRRNGIAPVWAVRALRKNEERDLRDEETRPFFYPRSDGQVRKGKLLKGYEHVLGMLRLVSLAKSGQFDIVHLQWSVVPLVDLFCVRQVLRHCPVVITVHDTTLYNGAAVNFLQRAGYRKLLASVDHIIVHTDGARIALAAEGCDPEAISVIPHGKLSLKYEATASVVASAKWKIVLFGRLQSYKGVDILIEALGRIDPVVRERLNIIIAGEPFMPLESLQTEIMKLNLERVVELRLWRHSEREMGELLHQADCFVFPYRAIEASGVFFLVADLGKWIIASDLGAFRDLLGPDSQAGRLVPPNDSVALADAICDSVARLPTSSKASVPIGWSEIGRMTRDVYEAAIRTRAAENRLSNEVEHASSDSA